MGEFLIIQVGQCGNQIGSSFWPLILQEYGINNVPGAIQRQISSGNSSFKLNESFHSFFTMDDSKACSEDSISKFSDLNLFKTKARAILIDMEDSVVDRFHTWPLKNLFDKSCTIRNYPGSGNNWAEGFYAHGSKYKEKIENTIRKAVEKCKNILGFLLLYSVGGGTGSGLGSFVLQMLEDNYPNVDRFTICVFPNGLEDVITCPYNMALATQYLTNSATCVFPIENRALLDIITKPVLKKCPDTNKFIGKCKPFQDMNTLIVNMLLHLTSVCVSGSRFSGELNVDMNDICTNLVPFPNMHFICSSVNPNTVSFDRLKANVDSRKIHNDIFLDCCHRKNQLVKLDPLGLNSILLGASLIGRGQFTMSYMRNYVDQLQNRGNFTPWSREAIKIGLCGVPPAGHHSSMLSLFNTSAMISLFDDVLQQFDKLYLKKAHVHHYTRITGFEAELFNDCKEMLLCNIEDYKSINLIQDFSEPRITVF